MVAVGGLALFNAATQSSWSLARLKDLQLQSAIVVVDEAMSWGTFQTFKLGHTNR